MPYKQKSVYSIQIHNSNETKYGTTNYWQRSRGTTTKQSVFIEKLNQGIFKAIVNY